VLAGLDSARQGAFAEADPAALAGVYSDGALLRQDQAELQHVVAPGCRLIGLRTDYRAVHAGSLNAHQVVLYTQASLHPARLICPHEPPQDMAAYGPVAMTIVLARARGGFLIAAIQLSA
jgi:hypothetical protein